MKYGSRDFKNSVFILAISINLFSWDLDSPNYSIYDEFRYVSAARQFIEGSQSINENWSHPPLGKILISIGIHLFGDNPVGWRAMSVLFGGITLVAAYFLGLFLFRNRIMAIQVALLCLLNQFLFVHSRIAMLEPFMVAFITVAWAFFAFYWMSDRHPKKDRFLCSSGAVFGLAMAVKWYSVVPLSLCALLIATNKAVKLRFRVRSIVGYFFLMPAATYMAVFLLCLNMVHPYSAPQLGNEKNPSLPISLERHSIPKEAELTIPRLTESKKTYTIFDFIPLQWEMLKAQIKFNVAKHPDNSPFYEWPWTSHLMWYDYSENLSTHQRHAVLLIGNPWIMWTGVISIFYCIWCFIKNKSKESLFICFMYVGCLSSWLFIPRTITFYYYYFPCTILLSLAIVYLLKTTRSPIWLKSGYFFVVTAVFIFFYPLISNHLLSAEEFQSRLWFKSWNVYQFPR